VLIVISPAKKLDFDNPAPFETHTKADFLKESQRLINTLRMLSELDLMELMNLSSKLSKLNFDRYYTWSTPFNLENAKQSIFAFRGDVYAGLDADSLNQNDLDFAQNHLRILSGLYGFLKPMDLMQPYRLEMGTRLVTERGKNLYEFWGEMITNGLNKALKAQGDEILINLASQEYFKSVKPKKLQGKIITPAFKELKNGHYKMIGIYAKKARGLLSRYIIQNKISQPDEIKSFDLDGYVFRESFSDDQNFIFTRGTGNK
jgi:uncharacterized protein